MQRLKMASAASTKSLGLFLLMIFGFAISQKTVNFEVEEGVPVGTIVGTIGRDPPYLIVPLDGTESPEADLNINQRTGEIRTRKVLDREAVASYVFSAIPLNGDSIRVSVKVRDVNDNAPEFPKKEVILDIPENIPKGTRRSLAPALDADSRGPFSTQNYEIVSGNVGEAFNVESNANTNVLDLVVKGSLDRERLDKYDLIIVASDGGRPPKSASMTLRVQVQDLNDSPPVFSRQRYFTTISENLPVGSRVMSVTASDQDAGDNARITYTINR